MRNIGARSVALLVLCFAGHAHFASSDVHGSYFVDDYIGIWTKFDGIGALSGGGVYIDERCYTHGYPRAQQYPIWLYTGLTLTLTLRLMLYTRPAVCIKKSVTMHTPGHVQILTITINLTLILTLTLAVYHASHLSIYMAGRVYSHYVTLILTLTMFVKWQAYANKLWYESSPA